MKSACDRSLHSMMMHSSSTSVLSIKSAYFLPYDAQVQIPCDWQDKGKQAAGSTPGSRAAGARSGTPGRHPSWARRPCAPWPAASLAAQTAAAAPAPHTTTRQKNVLKHLCETQTGTHGLAFAGSLQTAPLLLAPSWRAVPALAKQPKGLPRDSLLCESHSGTLGHRVQGLWVLGCCHANMIARSVLCRQGTVLLLRRLLRCHQRDTSSPGSGVPGRPLMPTRPHPPMLPGCTATGTTVQPPKASISPPICTP